MLLRFANYTVLIFVGSFFAQLRFQCTFFIITALVLFATLIFNPSDFNAPGFFLVRFEANLKKTDQFWERERE